MLSEISEEKNSSKKLTTLEENLTRSQSEEKNKIKQRNETIKLIEELNKKVADETKELDDIWHEKDRLQKKKEDEAMRVTQAVLKRKAVELTVVSTPGHKLKLMKFAK